MGATYRLVTSKRKVQSKPLFFPYIGKTCEYNRKNLYLSLKRILYFIKKILFKIRLNTRLVIRPGSTRYMGQCPAKSGLWGYNFITIKIAHCTKQHIFATVLRFPFKIYTLVPTPFLCLKIDFCDLHLFRAVDTTIVNPAG